MMSKWTRSHLKSNAKAALSGRYWRSFLLCLTAGAGGVGSYSTSVRSTYDEMTSTIEQIQNGTGLARRREHDRVFIRYAE